MRDVDGIRYLSLLIKLKFGNKLNVLQYRFSLKTISKGTGLYGNRGSQFCCEPKTTLKNENLKKTPVYMLVYSLSVSNK